MIPILPAVIHFYGQGSHYPCAALRVPPYSLRIHRRSLGAMEDNVNRIAVSIPEAAEMVGLSRAYLYGAVKAGQLRAKKAGKRSLVAVADLRDFYGGLPDKDPRG